MDLGFTPEDRAENVRRVGEVARLMADAGLVVMVCLVSPFREDRDAVRERVGSDFMEVFVDTPLEVAEARDVKGLYKKALAGEIKNFTGIDDPYEAPTNAEIVVDTEGIEPDAMCLVHRQRMRRVPRGRRHDSIHAEGVGPHAERDLIGGEGRATGNHRLAGTAPVRRRSSRKAPEIVEADLRPGKAGMYVCGVTVYDLCHIGHARSAIVFDVIRRYLRFRGYRVTFIKNYTDVDDRIIKRANDAGVTAREFAERFIAAEREDMASLGVLA